MRVEDLQFSALSENRFSLLPEKVRGAELRVLLGSNRPYPPPPTYQDKMSVHSHDDLLLSRVFPSSLKGAPPMTDSIHSRDKLSGASRR